jgi:hypothetical protein
MTTENLFNLQPGERVLKLTAEEIQLICTSLDLAYRKAKALAEELRPLNNKRLVDEVEQMAVEFGNIQCSIENSDKDV